jgi:hypothetical protein
VLTHLGFIGDVALKSGMEDGRSRASFFLILSPRFTTATPIERNFKGYLESIGQVSNWGPSMRNVFVWNVSKMISTVLGKRGQGYHCTGSIMYISRSSILSSRFYTRECS